MNGLDWEARWEEPDAARTLDVAQVVALEQAIAAAGTSLAELMDRAGASVARFVQERWDAESKVVVFCGKGNNGGDGWVAAQLLVGAGYEVILVAPCEPDEVSAHPAREAAQRCLQTVGASTDFELRVAPDGDEAAALAADADVILDALLGTGFHYDSLREPTHGWVQAIVDLHALARESGAGPAVVAVDVPSGLNAQDGTATLPVVQADFTVTMMAVKAGMTAPAGRALCGEVHVARIAPIEQFLEGGMD